MKNPALIAGFFVLAGCALEKRIPALFWADYFLNLG